MLYLPLFLTKLRWFDSLQGYTLMVEYIPYLTTALDKLKEDLMKKVEKALTKELRKRTKAARKANRNNVKKTGMRNK